MRIVDTQMEQVGPGRIRIITMIEVRDGSDSARPLPQLGEGPTGNAIPDRIVRCLIDHGPGSVSLAEIQRAVGGNPATVNRQAWTLATDAPDLQLRLRGWVMKADRGRYALTPAARGQVRQ